MTPQSNHGGDESVLVDSEEMVRWVASWAAGTKLIDATDTCSPQPGCPLQEDSIKWETNELCAHLDTLQEQQEEGTVDM